MSDSAGLDQSRDGFPNRHSYGYYTPQLIPPQQGYVWQPYPMQATYRPNTNATNMSVHQPQTSDAINKERPPNYMMASTLAICCCFWPIGIFALYYANKANNYAYAGDNAEARKKSATARRLVIASAIVGGALWILGFSFSIWPLLYAAGRGK